MSKDSFFLLLYWRLRSLWFSFLEGIRVIRYYWQSFSFLRIDFALKKLYLFQDPFHISKQFLLEKGKKDIYAYGETPLSSLEILCKAFSIEREDCVFELGCGRGRTCFWLASFIGCKVVGIEYIPQFVQNAQQIKEQFSLSSVDFVCDDFFTTSFEGATVLYLYGSCLSEEEGSLLTQRFSALPPETRIITTSYSLLEIDPTAPFQVLQEIQVPFPWGEGSVFLHSVTLVKKESAR